MTPTEDNPRSVLERATAILEAFGPDDTDVSLAALTARTGMAKTTIFRIANTMVELGLLEKTGRGYRLGLHLFELGERVPQQRELRNVAVPFLEDLSQATHHVVHLAVLDDTDVVYFAKIRGTRSSALPTRIGGRNPAHCTALGKAIVAYSDPGVAARVVQAGLVRFTPHTICAPQLFAAQLAEIRALGYAVEREESVLGNCCVAAPILAVGGAPVAAISVGGPLSRTDPDQLGPAVRTTALALSRELAKGRYTVKAPAGLRRRAPSTS